MLRLLSFLTSIAILGCTMDNSSIDNSTQNLPCKKLIDSLSSYSCKISLPNKNQEIKNKDIKIFQQWYNEKLPLTIRKKIESKEYTLMLSTYIALKEVNNTQMHILQQLLNDLESNIHLIIGSRNSIPKANLSFSFIQDITKKESYIQISIHKFNN